MNSIVEKNSTASGLPVKLGTVIKQQRQSLHLSQDELARRAGLHRTYIIDIEHGVRNPSLTTLAVLADALKLSCTQLIFMVEELNNEQDQSQSVLPDTGLSFDEPVN